MTSSINWGDLNPCKPRQTGANSLQPDRKEAYPVHKPVKPGSETGPI